MATQYIYVPLWYKGEDHELPMQITEDDGTTAIPLTDFKNIVVWIYDEKTQTVLGKYAWKTLEGHNTDDFVVTDAVQGEFYIRIQADLTRFAQPDFYIFELKVSELNTDYSEDSFHTITQEYFCKFKEALTKKLEL